MDTNVEQSNMVAGYLPTEPLLTTTTGRSPVVEGPSLVHTRSNTCEDSTPTSHDTHDLESCQTSVNIEDSGHKSSENAVSLTGVKISYDITPFSSTLSSLYPVCRICQNPAEKKNALLTPCRCDGSLKYVHGTCLRVCLYNCFHVLCGILFFFGKVAQEGNLTG